MIKDISVDSRNAVSSTIVLAMQIRRRSGVMFALPRNSGPEVLTIAIHVQGTAIAVVFNKHVSQIHAHSS